MTETRITANEIIEELARQFKTQAPEEAQTVHEMADATGLQPSTLQRELRRLHADGRLRYFRIKRPAIDGVLRWTVAYVILPIPEIRSPTVKNVHRAPVGKRKRAS